MFQLFNYTEKLATLVSYPIPTIWQSFRRGLRVGTISSAGTYGALGGGGRVGESNKASLGDRGTLSPEFDSPGEHSCSHTRALPLHIQFTPLLPRPTKTEQKIAHNDGTSIPLLWAPSTQYNTYTAHVIEQTIAIYYRRCKRSSRLEDQISVNKQTAPKI
jgi:hypothetical protein